MEELVLFNSNLIHKLEGTAGKSVFGSFSAGDAFAGGGGSTHTHTNGHGLGELSSPVDESFVTGTGPSGGIEDSTGNSLPMEHTSSGTSYSHGHHDPADHIAEDGDHSWEAAESAKSSESLNESLHGGVDYGTTHGVATEGEGASSHTSPSEMSDSTYPSSHSLHDSLHQELERPDDQSRADIVPSSGSTFPDVDTKGHGVMEDGSTESEGLTYDKDEEGLGVLKSELLSEGGEPVQRIG